MFTGIVEEVGRVRQVEHLSDSARLRVTADRVLAGTAVGDSIAVNGICLTVTDVDADSFACDVMAETLQRTSLAGLDAGDGVNLERAVPATGRLGGHIVQGHVDGIGTITAIEPSAHWRVIRISLPEDLRRYIVEKGSITVDGVSLTVADVTPDGFAVSCIPTTLEGTTLGDRKIHDDVNLEVDVIAKYVENLVIGYRA